MIKFERQGSKVICNVRIMVPGVGVRLFSFQWESGGEIYAALLEREMSDQLHALVETIRRTEYRNGLKCGRSKQAAQKYFRCDLSVE